MTRAMVLLGVAGLLAACAGAAHRREDPPATRDDVTHALYTQLDRTLERYASLEGDATPGAERERMELAQLADEIAMKIVRIDHDADIDALLARLEKTR